MIFKNLSKRFLISFLLIVFIFSLDRISKIYVIYLSNKSLVAEIFTSKFLNIDLMWNEGIAFGLLSFSQNHLYNFITIVIFTVILLILFLMIKSENSKKYGYLIIFSGAIGNLYDRIFFGAVPDFIDFHVGQFHWFIFNVADIFISVGVIYMILFELIDNKKIND